MPRSRAVQSGAGFRARHHRLVDETRRDEHTGCCTEKQSRAERSGIPRSASAARRRDVTSRRGVEKQSRAEWSGAEWSGDVALGITGSSMRQGKTSRRGAEQDSGAAFCARVQRLIDETKRADAALSTSAERSGISGSSMRQPKTSRRGAEKQSSAERSGVPRAASPARR